MAHGALNLHRMTPCNSVFSDPNANDADVGTGEAKRLGSHRLSQRVPDYSPRKPPVSHFNALAVTGEDKLLLEEWIG